MRILVFLVVLAGCGGSKPTTATPEPAASTGRMAMAHAEATPTEPPPAGDPPATTASAPMQVDAVRAGLDRLADEMCKCKDPACARRVSEDVSRWGAEATQANGGRVMSQAETEQIMPVAQRLAACMSDAMTKENGAP